MALAQRLSLGLTEVAKLTHVLASEAAQIVVEPILGSIISPCSVVGAIRVKNFNVQYIFNAFRV